MKQVTYKIFTIDELKKAFHYAKNLLMNAESYKKFHGVLITISLKKQKRSIKQNKYLWGVVYDMISEETGYTPQEVHDIMAIKYLKLKEIEYEGKVYPVTKSTTKLKTDEMEDYLAKIRRDASMNLSLYIPEPNEVPSGYYE